MGSDRWNQFASILASVAVYPRSRWNAILRERMPEASDSLIVEAVEYLDLSSAVDELTPRIPESNQRLAPGSVLRDRYVIVRSVGKGGLCEVYLAEDREAGDRVAIKALSDAYAQDPYLLALLRRELRISRALSHPNICRTFGIEDATLPDGSLLRFIVMEYLEGETLGDVLGRGPIDEAAARPIVEEVLDALEAAHKLNILHGDMKCSNVILTNKTSEQKAMVTDFGLARRLGPSQTQSLAVGNHVMGTIMYMPPEQFEGKPLTPAADIHALGVMMFRMVTGRFPFQGENWQETANLRRTQAAPDVRSINPKISDAWARCTMRALEADAVDRPQTIDEMRQVLRTGAGLSLTRRSRTRVRQTFAGALVIAAALSGYIWYDRANQAPPQNPEVLRHLKLGNEFLARRARGDFAQALDEYKAAAAIDANSDEAWIGLAETYGGMANWGIMHPFEALPKGIEAASKALQISPSHPRAHGIMGYLVSIDVKNWLNAGPHFENALSLGPQDARVHFWYATHLGRLGRHQEAISHLRTAQQIEPQMLPVGHQLAFEYERAGQLDDFVKQARELVRIQPLTGTAHATLARALIEAGHLEEAKAALRNAELYQADKLQLLFEKALLASARGAKAEVLALAQELEAAIAKQPNDSTLVAGAFALAGDLDKTLSYLYAGLKRGDSTVLTAHVQLAFRPYRQNPAFRKFIAATGLNP